MKGKCAEQEMCRIAFEFNNILILSIGLPAYVGALCFPDKGTVHYSGFYLEAFPQFDCLGEYIGGVGCACDSEESQSDAESTDVWGFAIPPYVHPVLSYQLLKKTNITLLSTFFYFRCEISERRKIKEETKPKKSEQSEEDIIGHKIFNFIMVCAS